MRPTTNNRWRLNKRGLCPVSFPGRSAIAQLLAFLLFAQAVVPSALASPRAVPTRSSRAGKAAGDLNKSALKGGSAAALAEPAVQQAVIRPASGNFGVELTPVTTPFNAHAGIEYHQPSREVLVSANTPTGLPNNFELIDGAGSHRAFSNVSGLGGALKVAAARDDGQGASLGGFRPGELFTGTGTAGAVARIAADGASVQNPWVTLPGEAGLPGGLYVDRTGVYGGDLIVVTTAGGVWRVNSAGGATQAANLGTPLAGVTTVPEDAVRYGPWAGKILVGAKAQGALYAVDAQGVVTQYALGLNPEEVRVVPAHENFFGVDPVGGKIWGAPADAFASMIGDILVAQASPGVLARIHWNGTDFELGQLAQAAAWQQFTFAPAGVNEIVGVKQVYDNIAVVRHAPLLDSGRVEGGLWQMLGESVTLDGTDVITSDLIVPGAPSVSVSGGHASYSGVIKGPNGALPSGYAVTLTGNASLRYLINRTDPIQLGAIAAPPAPAGTRDVSLTKAGESPGDFATLHNLTLSGQAGAVAVPPGTYGSFTASSHTALVLGVPNSTEPAAYNLEALSLSGGSELRLAGPVVLTVKGGVTLTGSTVGAADSPRRMLLRVAGPSVSLGGGSVLYGVVRIPGGAVSITGGSRLRGTVTCDRLDVNGNGVLQITESDVPQPPPNRPPVADAGPDQTITLPVDSVSLNGLVSDDGLPQGSALTSRWSVVSGPAPVSFADAASALTTATFTEPGVYVLQLTASDGLLKSSDQMQVEVVPRNQPPVVNAGDDQAVELPDGAALHGTASDDALPRGSTLTVTWGVVSGPGPASFASPNSTDTAVSFGAPGVYTLRLSADDTEFTSSDDVVVTVYPENQPPVVNAGDDQTIRLPSGATLHGTVSDDGYPLGGALTSSWSQVSGPGAASFANAADPATDVTFGAPGTYVLRLSVSDTRLTASDDVTVVVQPQNQPPTVDAGPDQTLTLPSKPPVPAAQPFALRALSTGFNSPIGIDYHQPTGKVVMSVNYNNGGQPYNLELVAADGARARFSNMSGLTDELKIATARDDTGTGMSRGGFRAGELFTGSGAPGVVVRVSPDGSQVQNPWVTLPGENGLMRGSLYVDRTGVYGGDLIVVTTTGGVWRINSSGQATQLTRLGTHLEGLQTIPNDPAKYGPWAGKILIGAEEQGRFYTVDAQGNSAFYNIGINPEDIDIIPANENFFGVDFAGQTLWGASAAMFSGMTGDLLVAQESPGILYRVHWNGSAFEKTQLAQVPQWEHVTFAPAGLAEIPTVGVTAALHGTVTDDNAPGFPLSLSWTKASGPGPVSFSNPNQAITTATFAEPGTYVLRLTADDTEFTVYDEVTITVNPGNTAPSVNAGPDKTVTLPDKAALDGVVSDDGLPPGSALSVTWTKVSGPGSVTFTDPNSAATTATFAAGGAYVLRLTAADSEFSVSDEVTVTVINPNKAPVANAGPDQTTTLPEKSFGFLLNDVASFNAAADSPPVVVDFDAVAPGTDITGGTLSGITFNVPNPLTPSAPLVVVRGADTFTPSGFSGVTDASTNRLLPTSGENVLSPGGAQLAPGPNAALENDDLRLTFAQPVTAVGFDMIYQERDCCSFVSVTVLDPNGAVLYSNPSIPTGSASGGGVPGGAAFVGFVSSSPNIASIVIDEQDGDGSFPDANIGFDSFRVQTVVNHTGTVTLNGAVTDDGLPAGAPLTARWTKVSGPASVSFSAPDSPVTAASFNEPGTYVLRLTGSDTELTGSDDVTVTVNPPLPPLAGATLTLTPAAAGPNVTGTSQALRATLKDRNGNLMAGMPVQFVVTGPNATSANTVTDASGVAAFAYTGRANGTDSVLATATSGSTQVQSNGSSVSWVTPVQTISTTTVLGRFFTSNGSGVFSAQPTQAPVFSQYFPTINFNPPAGTVPGNTSGVGVTTHPFTNVTTDNNGAFTGTIPAQGNGFQAGVGTLFDFNGVFNGSFTVAAAGDITFNFYSDDGFIFGVGGGATRVGGANTNAPASGVTPFELLPVMGAYNVATAPVANSITVHFPGPGTYPYEVDYSECCGGELSLTMTTAASGNHGVPPTGALALTPNTVPQKTTGEQLTFNVAAVDASGAALANLPVVLTVVGANTQQLRANTDAAGRASFSYVGRNPGTDTVQVSAPVGSTTAYSNVVAVQWKAAPNTAPVVNAGPDKTITLPTNSVSLGGTVTDDGLPSGGALSVSWTKVSGPGAVTFGNPSAAATTATFGAAGAYVLRLTANDTQLSASDDVTVNVNPAAPVNQAPNVNAGPDQTVVLPSAATLSGTVTDDGLPTGAAVTSTWTKVSGPGAVSFGNAGAPATTASFGAAGAYVLRLTASDSQLSASDDVTVTVLAPATPNKAPVVSAGPDQTVAMGLNLLQNGGGEAALVGGEIPAWAEVSGSTWTQATAGANGFPPAFEGGTYFYAGDAASAELRQDVDVTALAAAINAGAQQFEFQARLRSRDEASPDVARVILEYRSADNSSVIATLDSGPVISVNDWLTTEDTRAAPAGTGWIRIRLLATRNTGATNDAYFDGVALHALATAGVKLAGTVTDDGLPTGGAVTSTWTKVSGPGAVSFADSHAPSTSAVFDTAGTYVLRLSASDTDLSASDDVTVVVIPANRAPVVNAGADQTITLPNETVLSGVVTDDGLPQGSTLQISWTKVSGPGSVAFGDANSAETEATFGAAGTYVLRLSANDSEFTAADDITVTVKPAPPNQAPLANAGPDQTINMPADTVTLAGAASDDGLPSGSTLTTLWTKVSGPGAVTFGDPNSAATTARFAEPGVYVLRLTASDTQLTATDDVTVTVNGVNKAPTVDAGPDQTVTLPNTATLGGTATDDGLPAGSALSVTWTKVSGPGSVTFSNPNSAAAVATFGEAGSYVLQLSAGDSALTSNDQVTVNVNPAVPPPTVGISSPADGSEVTTRTPIVGTVSEGSSWRLEYSPAGGAPSWTTLASGGTPVNNGLLAVFDPTLLLNGTYVVRLVATDAASQTSTTTFTATVTGQQKIGNFSVSFTDLGMAVAGLPVEVTRTYDSRDKRVGDFGFGWTLGVRNVRVEKSGVLGSDWEETRSGGILPSYCLQPTKPRFVTVTFPDGKVYKFQATTNPQCQRVQPVQFATMGFTPATGTKGSLVALGDNDVIVFGSFPGPVELRNEGDLEFYNPTQFQLTTEDGSVYVLDQNLGVRSVTDANGNTLTVNADGITHSSGRSVTFTRDAQGRIAQITDPAGSVMFYTYDANGDLVSFKDREGNTTTFTYNSTHGLLGIKDPRGIQPARYEYDDEGRLIRQTDAFGKVTNITHDPNTRQEVVTDRLGNVTTFEYDGAGNVVRITDAQGKITRRAYDADNNLLTETDPLGRTTTYTYDAAGNRATETDALGNTTRRTYNARRQLLTETDPAGHVATYVYDAKGNLTSETDGTGNTSGSTYDGKGNETSATDALGRVSRFEYDAAGNLTKETDPLGDVTTYTYDANNNRLTQSVTRTAPGGTAETLTTTFEYDRVGRQTKVTLPDGSTTETAYDADGKVASQTDALGRRTAYEYDDMGRVVRVTFPDGKTEESSYDAEGRRTKRVDAAGRATAYEYDSMGRLTKTTDPDGGVTRNAYDSAGQVTSVTDERGNTTAYEYDADGHRAKVTDPVGNVTTYAYDAAGNLASTTDAKGQTTRYEYDAANRRTKVVYPDGSSEAAAYDASGRATAKTDQAGQTTNFEFDARGKLTKVTDALGGVTRFAYDELGNLVTQTDANGHATSFEYDRLGRRTKRTLPLGMSEVYAYDAAGELTSRTDFRGKKTTYAYDSMRRLLSKTPDPSLAQPGVTFTYTATGKRATMQDASGLTTYTYDALDRLRSKATPQGTLTYTYDAAGNMLTARSSHANGLSADYAYDAAERLQTVTDRRLGAEGVTAYAYDANGNLESTLYPNQVQTNYAYNSLNRLTNVSATRGATLASYAYTLGAAGNRLSVTEADGRSVGYSYDALYRLTAETISGDPANDGAVNYTYDAVGNRLTRASTVAAVPSATSTYDANDRLNGETYDANGNAVVSGGAAYAFDFENRISESGGGSVVVTYDGDGNRVAETAGGVTTRYLVDTNNPTGHAQVVEELDAAGQVARQYTYGHDLISQNQVVGGAWRVSFYGYDGQGSVRQLTDAAGAVTDTYAYDAFGNLIARTGSTPNSYLYTGEQFDANLGFYYLRARYLNTATGRFQSSDTFEGSVFEPLSLHKYTYVHNDPPNGVDPTGHFGDFSIGGLCTSMAIGATISAISGLNAHSTLESVATDLLTGAIEGALFYLGGGLILKSAASLFRYIRVVRSARALSAIEGVFSRIQNAGELFPGTEVPTRFTFSTRVGEFFISGAERGGQPVGAIKHVVELLTRGTASQTRMATALVLEDLEGAIVNASTQGITYGEKMIVGNWELIFEEAGVSGPLPKLFHAVYLGS